MEPLKLRRLARERGTALFVALIMLVAMSIAAVSLVRSVDTAVVVSGNLAFQQAALQAADFGIEQAVQDLREKSKEDYWSTGDANVENAKANYRPVMFARNQIGKPTVFGATVDIAGVPSVDWSGIPKVSPDEGEPAIPDGFEIQYIIDRMCTGTPPITDLAANCVSSGADQPGGSKSGGVGETAFTWVLSVQYRITVRVTGPNNAQSFVQVVLAD